MSAYQIRAARRAAAAAAAKSANCYRYWVIRRNELPRNGAGK
ncbi:MAG TPA: hypothetical protein VFL91_21205 [Thermomicrobiales bacterium]|nr:hypothetical protein [Thermomicrobiales bacterium]